MNRQDVLHYAVLFGMLGLSLYMASVYRGHTGVQMMIGSATAVGYVFWGIFHHTAGGTIHRNIVVEYVLIGLIAIVLLLYLAI